MGIKSTFSNYYRGIECNPYLALFLGGMMGTMGGMLGTIGKGYVDLDDGREGSTVSTSRANNYKNDAKALSAEEAEILTLKKSIDSVKLLALMEDDEATGRRKVEKARAKIAEREVAFKTNLADMTNRVILDQGLSEKDMADVIDVLVKGVNTPIPGYQMRTDTRGLYMSASAIRECEAALPQASGVEVTDCSRNVSQKDFTHFGVAGVMTGIAGALFLPFGAAAFRRRKPEEDAPAPIEDTSVSTTLKIIYTVPAPKKD